MLQKRPLESLRFEVVVPTQTEDTLFRRPAARTRHTARGEVRPTIGYEITEVIDVYLVATVSEFDRYRRRSRPESLPVICQPAASTEGSRSNTTAQNTSRPATNYAWVIRLANIRASRR